MAVVAVGVALIAGIVIASPGWQRIIASGRGGSPAPSAGSAPVAQTPGDGTAALAVRPDAVEPARATPAPAASVPPPPAPVEAAQTAPPRASVAPRPADRPPAAAQPDTAMVMASLLLSQLGLDPAWRLASANAEAHAPDSPEFMYWRRVAAAIRDGGFRTRQ